jgi:cysteine desulfurase
VAARLAARAIAEGMPAAVERERDRLERALLDAVPGARPTVSGAPRAPHVCSLALPGFPAEPLLHALEARGVYASAGSACASRTRGPTPSLKAIGVDDSTAVLRLSLSRLTTVAEVDATATAFRMSVEEISPLARGSARR